MFPWIAFIFCGIIAYIGISLFAQLSSSGASAIESFFSTLKPLPLFVVTVANMFFGVALFYGFSVTRFAIPSIISIGVITSFLYSIFVLGASITLTKVLGILVIILGIILMAL